MGEQIGYDFSEPVDLEGYPKQKRINGKWTQVEKWRIHTDYLDEYLPGENETDDSGRVPGEITVSPVPAFDGVVEVSFSWKDPESVTLGSVDRQAGSVIYESEAQLIEKNLESHIDWDDFSALEQEEVKKALASFAFVSVNFKRSEIKSKSNFKFTQAEILGNASKIEAPTGLLNATSGNWLNMGKTLRWEQGSNIEVVETWKYDQNGFAGMVLPDKDSLKDFYTNKVKK